MNEGVIKEAVVFFAELDQRLLTQIPAARLLQLKPFLPQFQRAMFPKNQRLNRLWGGGVSLIETQVCGERQDN